MPRAVVNGESPLALAYVLFACAGLLELVVMSPSGALCEKSTVWVLAPAFSVPFLWLGGVVSLYWATRDRGLRGGRWTALGGVVAIFVGITYLPALASTVMGCVA
jgi:uncharacterized membrane protein HdeD (DUF308 family)